jgi:hypothetical protein
MEENLQTEQVPDLNEEQLTTITGGASILGITSKISNAALHGGHNWIAQASSKVGQVGARLSSSAGKTFEVNKSWADRLT